MEYKEDSTNQGGYQNPLIQVEPEVFEENGSTLTPYIKSNMKTRHQKKAASYHLSHKEEIRKRSPVTSSVVPFSKSREAKASILSLMSALYALILIILAVAFEISYFVDDHALESAYDPFFIYLYTIGLLFLLYCYLFLLRTEGWKIPIPFYRGSRVSTSDAANFRALRRKTSPCMPHILSAKRKVTYATDSATGSMYLRLGATVFGILGVLKKLMNIYMAMDQNHFGTCYGMINLIEDLLGAIFIFVQLYFIFENSKVTIHKFIEIGYFGTMHLVATNICIWIQSLFIEQRHIILDIHKSAERHQVLGSIKEHDSNFLDLHNSTHSKLACGHYDSLPIWTIKPFLTTCLVEYAVICAAITYILWKNTGQKFTGKTRKFKKQHMHIDCSSSSRGLFAGLLFVAFTLISLMAFFNKVHNNQDWHTLWVCIVSDITLYTMGTVAVVWSMFQMRHLLYLPTAQKGSLLDDILLVVGLVSQLLMCIFAVVALIKINWTSGMIVFTSLLRMIQVLLQTVFIFYAQRLCITPWSSTTASQMSHYGSQTTITANYDTDRKPGRELITFLLLANLAMFLISTFETQKSGANLVTIEFYGKAIWSAIVYSTTPLNTFYRFHSSVCLAEIWKVTYRTKYGDFL